MSKSNTDEEILLDEVTESTKEVSKKTSRKRWRNEPKEDSDRKYKSFNLNLKIDNPNEEQLYDFLISIGNKRSQLIIHAVEEFTDKYNLKGASKQMIQLFLKEYIPNQTTVVSGNSSFDKPIAEEKKTDEQNFNENIIDSSLLDKAKAQLRMFGVT